MRNLMHVSLGLVCAIAVLAGSLLINAEPAHARAQYLKGFIAKYPDVKQAKAVKCGVCHPGKDKHERNAYGQALGGILKKENVKEAETIKAALTEAEAKEGPSGKTFGELLKDGKLPCEKK